MSAWIRYGVWWTVPALLLGWVMSLGCATASLLDSRERAARPWNPSQEIATGAAHAYITAVAPLSDGGWRYTVLLRGLLLGRPADEGFSFTVDEVPQTPSVIWLAEPTTPAATPLRGQPLQIWHPGMNTHAEQLTCRSGAPDQVLVERMSWDEKEVTFYLKWRTLGGGLHSGVLHVTPNGRHSQTLARLGRGLAFVPELVGCVAVDTVTMAVAIPVLLIYMPVAKGRLP